MSKRHARSKKREKKARRPRPPQMRPARSDVASTRGWLALARAQRQTVEGLLANGIDDESCDASVENTVAFAQRTANKSLPLISSKGAPVACKDGCHWCCYLRVATSVPEMVWLANHIRKSWPDEKLAALRDRLEQLAADPRVISKDLKPEHRIACALLEDGRCSVYTHRPLACRKAHAFDAAMCERSLDVSGIPGERNNEYVIPFEAAALGMEAGFGKRGAPSATVELTRALAVALREDNALERWISGDPLFTDAELETSELQKEIEAAVAAE
jgi:uncharacterized protein